jgi:hypothetical protein
MTDIYTLDRLNRAIAANWKQLAPLFADLDQLNRAIAANMPDMTRVIAKEAKNV